MDRSPTIFRTIKQNSGSDTTGSFRETWGEALPRLYHTMLPVSSPKVWAQERPQAPVDSFPKGWQWIPPGFVQRWGEQRVKTNHTVVGITWYNYKDNGA